MPEIIRDSNFQKLMAGRTNAYLESKWSRNLGAVRAACPGITPNQLRRLALVLENTDRELKNAQRRIFESTTQVPDIGPFRLHVFDMITAMYPNAIIEDLISVQALPQKVGQIFFLSVMRGNTKGEIQEGTPAFSPWSGAAEYSRFSTENVDNEPQGTWNPSSGLSGHMPWVPVRRGSITFTDGDKMAIDDGNGNLTVNGVNVGSIDYDSGSYELLPVADFSDSATITASYMYNQEHAPAYTGKLTLRVDETIITARPHKLSATYSFDAGYDLQAAYGMDIDNLLLEAATAELRHERDGIIISNLYAQSKNKDTWNIVIPPALTQREHFESFIHHLFFCATRINQETKRGAGNWVVTGKTGMDVLHAVGAPRFEGSGNFSQPGPHPVGTLDKMMKVYYNPFMNEDQYLVGFKGQNFLDAGYVLGDYLPLFSSQMIMLEDFMGRRGYASLYGTRMINAGMYLSGIITRNPNPPFVTVTP